MNPDADILPINWDVPAFGIRLSLASLDEFGVPMDKRGISARLPLDKSDYEAFAHEIASSVRKTVLHILNENRRELPE